jgi:hypothetical protein
MLLLIVLVRRLRNDDADLVSPETLVCATILRSISR